MTFATDFSEERQRLRPLFSAAEKADRIFHAAWDKGVSDVGVSRYKKSETYSQTLDRFHATTRAIDCVISKALADVKQGDLRQLATLVAYLDLPGRYFRSGYNRTKIWRLLKAHSLDEVQSAIVRRIILQHVETAGPEFSDVAMVAAKVNSPDFYRDVQKLRESVKGYVSNRAERLLMHLESGREQKP